jgi:hypothetical protein
VSEIEVSSFDALVSSDPLQVLKSKRPASVPDVDTQRIGNPSNENAEPAAGLSNPKQITTTELLPRPPMGILPDVSLFAHGTRLAIAGVSLLALAVVVGVVGLSRRVGAKGAGGVGVVHAAVSIAALPEPRTPSQTKVASSVLAVPTQAPATAPIAAPIALAVRELPAAATATEPRSRAPAGDHRPNAKTAVAGLSKIGRPQRKRNCDPPYFIDPSGIRRVKRECL